MTSVAIKPAILDVITGLWVPRSLISSSSIVYLLLLSDSDLLVSVSASYWRLLPGSRRSMATATSVALGLEWDPWRPFLPLTPCFQLWFLLGMCWVWSFAYLVVLIEVLRGRILNPKQQTGESLKKHLDVFEALFWIWNVSQPSITNNGGNCICCCLKVFLPPVHWKWFQVETFLLFIS